MKRQINEIKKMQRLAGLITESEYQESLMNENMTLDPIKLKALVRALKTHGGFIGDRQSYKEIADLLSSNQLAKAANTIVNLDTSPNEMVYDMIKSTYPELWDMLFDNEEDDYIAAARPKAGLPESSINEAKKDIPSILRKWDAAPGDRLDYQTVANMIEVGRIEAAAKFIKDELDTSIREMMMDIIEENDPALWNKMFGFVKTTPKVSPATSDMDDDNKLGFSSDVKAYIDNVVKSAKADGEFEDLKNSGFFDNELILNIIEEFDEDGDYDDVNQAVKDYIAKVTR